MSATATETPVAGVCRCCECSEADPCDEGCSWFDDSQTLCSECALADGFAGVQLAARRQFEEIAKQTAALGTPERWRQVLAMTSRAFLERYREQIAESLGANALADYLEDEYPEAVEASAEDDTPCSVALRLLKDQRERRIVLAP